MPVIKSAIKKLKQDRRKEITNDAWRKKVQDVTRNLKKSNTAANLASAYAIIDKAAKHKIFHKNRAARLKSKLSKLVTVAVASKPKASPRKKTAAVAKKA